MQTEQPQTREPTQTEQSTQMTQQTQGEQLTQSEQLTQAKEPTQVEESVDNTFGYIWHQRLGHVSAKALKETARRPVGVPKDLGKLSEECIACVVGKGHRQPFPTLSIEIPLQWSYCMFDIAGPMKFTIDAEEAYFSIIVDDRAKNILVDLLIGKWKARVNSRSS